MLVRRRARVRLDSTSPAVPGGTHEGQQAVGVGARVPDLQLAHAGQPAHRRAVRGDGLPRRSVGLGLAVPVLAGGHGDARGEPFDVPLEGAGEGLVEVVEVEVEGEGAFRGGVQAEVEQVGVAAELHGEAGVGLGGEIGGHHGGRAAQEGEGGGGHPAVADRQQLREPVAALPFQYGDGVGAVDGRDPDGVGGTGDEFAGGAAALRSGGGGVHVPCLRVTLASWSPVSFTSSSQ